MAAEFLPITLIGVPIIAAAIIFTLGRTCRLCREGVAFGGTLLTVYLAALTARHVITAGPLQGGPANLRADGLSGLVVLLVSVITLIIVGYSLKYMQHQVEQGTTTAQRLVAYYGLVMLFQAGMMWVCLTNNMIWLYVALEGTTLATALLVCFYWNRTGLEASYKYLLLVLTGMMFALFGTVLLYAAAAQYAPGVPALLLTELGRIIPHIPREVSLLAVAFFIVGFGMKAGLVPFHAWLPDAHSEAPAPISALLSALVIKVGAYALARTISIFAPHYSAVIIFVAIMASASMLIGIFMAWAQDDLKRLLAFHSVSQMGYVIEGLGFGTYLGIYGGLFHLVNHAIFKALLFLSVGAIMYATGGVRRISQLKGLGRKMPITAACFFIGAIAMGGLPPFNGFMSKLTLFIAGGQLHLWWAVAIGIIVSILTLACMVHAGYKIFWGHPTTEPAGNPGLKEVPASIWIGMVVLAILCLVIGIYPQLLHPLLHRGTESILAVYQAGGGITH